MVNPHQQSQYENTCISPGNYQHKEKGTDGFDRRCNCGHGVNHFRNYGDYLYQYGSNEIYSPVGYSGNQCNSWIRCAGDFNQFFLYRYIITHTFPGTNILGVPRKNIKRNS